MGCCSGRPSGFTQTNESFKISYESRPTINFDSIHSISDENLSTLVKLKDAGDVAKLISYIDDDTPISELLEVNHPWAKPPKTLGSAACMFLVLMFIHEESSNSPFGKLTYEQVSSLLTDTNALQKVKKNLNVGHQDRVELTILLLMFMVDESELIRKFLRVNNLFEEILPFLCKESWKFDHSSGLRIAALQYLKLLYSQNPVLRKIFMSKHGPNEIVDIFKEKNDSVVFECLNAVDELTFSEINETLRDPETIKNLVKIGIYDSLIALNKDYDEELKKPETAFIPEKFEVKKNIKTYLFFMKNEFNKYMNSDENGDDNKTE